MWLRYITVFILDTLTSLIILILQQSAHVTVTVIIWFLFDASQDLSDNQMLKLLQKSSWSNVFYDLWRSWARWACLCWPTMNAGPLSPNYSRTKSAPGARRMGQGGHVRWVFPDGYSWSLLNGSWVHIILKSLIIFSWPFLRIYSHDWWW